jgi:peroxiredoxin
MLSCSSEKNEEGLKIGDRAPDFTVKDLDGSQITLSDYAGSPVILRFFLTDCKFCRADTPVFNDYYARYKSQGLKILYLDSLGTDYSILSAFKQELQISFPIALDIGGRVSRNYKVKAMPQTIILDPQHKIVSAG